ncbi:MAG TPA: DnaB-like helicase C-terminal domain-containing protein [Gemmatimonadaceae bacterium]|nr:DnaB-like helicase C-terminal domain-containing protein [Gemmatimonadaceae bacterium]
MTRSTDISPLSVLLSRVDAVMDGAPPIGTIASGFPSLDKMLGGGFRRGDLVVLSGDTASGKSALALAIALRAAVAGSQALFLSGEMTVDRVLERVIAIEARTRIDDLRLGTLDDDARAKAGAVALELRDHLPVIDRIPAGGVPEIGSLVDAAQADLVVVDSLSSLAPRDVDRDEAWSRVIRELKELALDRNVIVFSVAELPGLVPRADPRPTLDDFAAHGAVKRHADVVLAIYRPDMYEQARDIAGATELLVRKNRNGPTGYVDLYFYPQWMRFEDMLDPER